MAELNGKKVFGIDLGTTYSVIATLDDNNMPMIIANQDDSSDLLASAVYFQEGAEPVVGEAAKSQKDAEPDRVVEFVKRFIGKLPSLSWQEISLSSKLLTAILSLLSSKILI